MAELRTEEEQVEALKNWWKENGKSLLIGVTLALVAVFGWRGWNQHQDDYAANASLLYEGIINPVNSNQFLDDSAVASLVQLGDQLRQDFDASVYSPMAAMVLARVLVDSSDLDGALEQLDYVVSSEHAPLDMKSLATLRSAKIYLAKGDVSAAADAVAQSETSIYGSLVAELKGDVAAAQGRFEDARASYESAMSDADPQRQQVIKLKFDDLAQGERS